MKLAPWQIVAIGVGILALGYGGQKVYNMTRGLRNNNPGNIRFGSTWQGMSPTQTDPSFIQFATPEYGIRAIGKILDTYAQNYGLNTVAGLINRWAPSSENDTGAYIAAVAGDLGVDPNDAIDVQANKAQLIAAIITHENGTQPYSMTTIDQGISLA